MLRYAIHNADVGFTLKKVNFDYSICINKNCNRNLTEQVTCLYDRKQIVWSN